MLILPYVLLFHILFPLPQEGHNLGGVSFRLERADVQYSGNASRQNASRRVPLPDSSGKAFFQMPFSIRIRLHYVLVLNAFLELRGL